MQDHWIVEWIPASKCPACPFPPLVCRSHIPRNPSATLYKQNNMVSRADLRQRERLQAMAHVVMCTRKPRSVALLVVVFCAFTYYKGQLRLVSVDFGCLLPLSSLHLLDVCTLLLGFHYLLWDKVSLSQSHIADNGANLPCALVSNVLG